MRYIQFISKEIKLLQEHVSKDNIKYTLNGVFFSDKEKDTVVAIDGRRLVSIDKAYPKSMEGKILKLPKIKASESAVLDIKNKEWLVYPRKKDYEVGKLIEGVATKLSFQESTMPCEFQDGKYPNYTMFLPKDDRNKAITIGLNGGLFLKNYKYVLDMDNPLSPVIGTMDDLEEELDYKPRVVIMPMKYEETN